MKTGIRLRSGAFAGFALVAAAIDAGAANYFWRGTAENPVWDATAANWAADATTSARTTYQNDTTSSQPTFDAGGAADVTVAADGVKAYFINLRGGTHTLSGGQVTAEGMDPLGGNLVILNTVNCKPDGTVTYLGFRPRAGGSTVTVGNGGVLDAQIVPWSDSTLATRLVVADGGILKANFNQTSIQNNIFTLCFDGGTLIHKGNDEKTFGKSKFVLGPGGVHVKDMSSGGTTWIPGPIGTDSESVPDGGVIIEDHSDYMLFSDTVNTYVGGLHVAGRGSHVGFQTDANLGAVPSEPADNVFFESGSSTVLVGHGRKASISANRGIRIADGVTARMGAYNDTSALVVHGAISSDNEQNSIVYTLPFTHTEAKPAGPISLEPGEGRTNRIGRLLVEQTTIVGSGTTLLLNTTALGTSGNETNGEFNGSPLYVHELGNLMVTGGVLRVEGPRPITIDSKFTVSGGLADFEGHEILHARGANALTSSGAVTTVKDGGRLHVATIRVAERGNKADASKSVLNVENGGVLRVSNKIYIHSAHNGYKATVNFDGGVLEWANANSPLFGNDAASLNGISYNVLAGGMIVTNDVECRFYPAVKSGAAQDGGITKWGSGSFSLHNAANTFNGPISIMQGPFRLGGNNVLPATATARVAAGAAFLMNTMHQTLARIEGSGTFSDVNPTQTSPLLSVTSAIAPGMGADEVGTLTVSGGGIDIASGTALEIDIGENGACDKFAYPAGLDLSSLRLVVNDVSKLDKNCRYGIVSASDGCIGEFASTNLPDTWHVRYLGDSVELAYTAPFVLVLR